MSQKLPTRKRTTSQTTIIGRNLVRLRKRYGFSQREVASELGTSFQQVQKYEKGQNRISAEKLHLLKQFYDVPYALFFEGLPDQKTSKLDDTAYICKRLKEMKNEMLRQKLTKIILLLSA